MKPHRGKFRLIRKGGRKKSRTKIGWRVCAIYIITLMLAGALATALDLRLQDQEKAQEAGLRHR